MEAEDFARQFTAALDGTSESREQSEKCRDYRDGHQWTSDQAALLSARGQAPIVINRIAPKVDFLIGVERSNRTDPKAYPRTPDHDEDAEAVTDALRFVADNAHLDETFSECFEELIVEGTAAVSVDVKRVNGQVEVEPDRIPWDRFYHDPHSRERDFSDAQYLGVTAWMEPAEVKRLFPDAGDDVDRLVSTGIESETFSDRPSLFVDSKRRRVRVNRHCYRDDKGVWSVVYFSADTILRDAQESPLLDAKTGEPECPIIAQSLFVDRENRRYGLVNRLLDPQDEVNHRRSKALWMLSNRSVWQTHDGVIPDPLDFLNQLSSARGVATANGVRGQDWDILDNGDLAQGQALMLAEAKAEIDNIGVNASLAGKQQQALSGRALAMEQSGGMQELGVAFDTMRHLKVRVYRAIWSRIKQFWTEERWVRVTDNEDNARFVGLNQQVTRGDLMLRELQARQRQGQPVQPVDVSDPSLLQVVGVERPVAEIDVDIIVSESEESVSVQSEQFAMLVQMYQANPNGIPWEAIVRASQLRNKREILEGLQDPEQSAAIQQAQQLDQADRMSQIQKRAAETALTQARTMETNVSAGAKFVAADQAPFGPMEAAQIRKAQAEAMKAEREARGF